MRIGMFAKLNNLSIDTIRYYIDLKLIHPIRKGQYFYFEEEQQEELEKVLYFKKLKFTLEEIKSIITAQELSKIKTTIESKFYIDTLLKKKDDLDIQILELSEIVSEIEDGIKKIKKERKDNYKECGIAFNNLNLICCPKCGNDIKITKGIVRDNGVYEGKSECGCGYLLTINQGIIVTKHNFDNIMQPYVDDYNYIDDDFMNETSKTHINFVINSSREIIRLLTEKRLSDKVILFMKSEIGLLETSLLEQCQDIKLMILIDDDFNKLRIAKKSIEINFPNCNIIYVCSEFHELPIKINTIDIAIDFFASFLNGFKLDYNIYNYIIPLLKEKSSIIGLYLYSKHFQTLSKIPECHRKFFDGRTILENIKSYNYDEISNYKENILDEDNDINNFFSENDIIHSKIVAFDRNEKQ